MRPLIEPSPANSVGLINSEAGRGRVRKDIREGNINRKIEQTIAYMTQHLDQPLPVARLAALTNISPSHFFALFKRHTGCAPIDYFIRLRMRRACELLSTTSLSVKEVAAVLGYDDQFYFSRVFKSVNRVAPSDYRVLVAEMERAERSAVVASSEREELLSQQTGTGLRDSRGWSDKHPHEQNGIAPTELECILR